MGINEVSVFITVISITITALSIFTDTKDLQLFRRDKYKGLYGNYKMFNYSRERTGRFVEWNVEIRKRWLKTPSFKAEYTGIPGQHSEHSGSLRLEHGNMIVMTYEVHGGRKDFQALVFNAPSQNSIVAEVGFLCGFARPPNPYCGLHVLCSKDWTAADIKPIFDSSRDGKCYEIEYEYFERKAIELGAAKAGRSMPPPVDGAASLGQSSRARTLPGA